jgi:hypothetical protein
MRCSLIGGLKLRRFLGTMNLFGLHSTNLLKHESRGEVVVSYIEATIQDSAQEDWSKIS